MFFGSVQICRAGRRDFQDFSGVFPAPRNLCRNLGSLTLQFRGVPVFLLRSHGEHGVFLIKRRVLCVPVRESGRGYTQLYLFPPRGRV